MLCATRIGTIHSGDASDSISLLGNLVCFGGPAPPDLDLDILARETNAIKRARTNAVEDGTTLLRLSLARGPGGKSLQQTAAWAYLNGVAQLTAQSLHQRLHGAVTFLAAVTHRLLAGRAAATPALWSGRCLRIVDSSALSQPGSKGTDWRVHAVYDLSQGGFSHLELTDRSGAESLLRSAPVANEVEIGDRGYAKAKQLRACLDPSGPHAREFIVRVGWCALALRDAAGEPFNLTRRWSSRRANPVRGNTPCRRWSDRPARPNWCRCG